MVRVGDLVDGVWVRISNCRDWFRGGESAVGTADFCPTPSPARPPGAAERRKERTRMRPSGADAPGQP